MTRTDTNGRPLEPGRYLVNGQPRRVYLWENVKYNPGSFALFLHDPDCGLGLNLDNAEFDNATFERMDPEQP